MPSYYYTFGYNMNDKFKVRFIALDTTNLLSYTYAGCLPESGVQKPASCCGDTIPDPVAQIQWFKDTLEQYKDDTVVVFGHHFLVSGSEDGLHFDVQDRYLNNPDCSECGLQCDKGDAYFGGFPQMRQVSNILAEYDNAQLALMGIYYIL